MTDKQWIDEYIEHKWDTQTMSVYSSKLRKLLEACEEERELHVCSAESGMARDCYLSKIPITRMFFEDCEQLLVLRLDKQYGGNLYRLVRKHGRYPIGTLVYVIYTGVNIEEPLKSTCLVAIETNKWRSNNEQA